MKRSFQQLASITAFTLVLISYFSTTIALQAISATPIRFNPPPPPPDRGAPGKRKEGASRGECASRMPLTALVPSYNEQHLSLGKGDSTITQVWGLTSAEKPSFWFYVPYNQSFIQEIEFVLQTDKNKTIYRTPVSIPPSSGIVRVQLKNTATSLEVDKLYRWFFKVKVACNSQQTVMADYYVEGWVERENLDATSREQLKSAGPQQQAAIYALAGIWYDTLTTLAELRLASPQDPILAEDWKTLLKEVGLEEVARQPLVITHIPHFK